MQKVMKCLRIATSTRDRSMDLREERDAVRLEQRRKLYACPNKIIANSLSKQVLGECPSSFWV